MSDSPPISDPINVGTAFDLIGRKKEGKPRPFAGCPRCREPLVSTMEFSGAEFICVPCDHLYGFLAPTPIEPSDEVQARHDELQAQYDAAREARALARSGESK